MTFTTSPPKSSVPQRALGSMATRAGKLTSLAYSALMLVTAIIAARYFAWRFTSTLPAVNMTGAALYAHGFVLVDLYMALVFVVIYWPLRRRRSRVGDVRGLTHSHGDRKPPLVYILIPTYDEPERVIEKAVAGVLGLEYESYRVWVLDDGKRDWLESRCGTWGIGYLRRTDDRGRKPGNLNAGIAQILRECDTPDYWAVFDADFVAMPQFLRRTVGLAETEGVALVQTPQFFYNPDPLQKAFGRMFPDCQRFLFDIVMPSRDASENASCCGTSYVVRAAGLTAVGGFPTETTSEDTLLSMRLGARGLRTIYLNEPLSMGLATEGLREQITQQGRWCLAWMQIAHTEVGPFSRASKPFWKRCIQCVLFLGWGVPALFRLAFLAVPILYWFTGLYPIHATDTEVIRYYVPFWISMTMTRISLSKGTDFPFIADAMNVLTDGALVRATLQGLGPRRQEPFLGVRATPKGLGARSVRVHWRLLGRNLLLLALTVVGCVYHLLSYAGPEQPFMLWAILWSLFNVSVLLLACLPCVERPERRADVRFETREQCMLRWAGQTQLCSLVDLGVGGALVSGWSGGVAGRSIVLTLDGVGDISASIVRAGDGYAALTFNTNWATRRSLIAKLYSFATYQPVKEVSLLQLMRSLVKRFSRSPARADARITGARLVAP